MRVISGSAKGRKISAPKGMRLRPTSDRVKEAIFNIIAPHVVGCRFLDLFAGTGNIGIEALSRGASKCTFIDQWSQSIKYIKLNLEKLAILDKSIVIKGDVKKIVEVLDDTYDIVFMDPPYGYDLVIPVLEKISLKLSKHGIVIIETEQKLSMPFECGGLRLTKTNKYGDTQVSYYKL
ncbi:MAG: 16S rRNA (guanine(966)-N(2))-methyltransferase RsmD [Bacillota bacterium]